MTTTGRSFRGLPLSFWGVLAGVAAAGSAVHLARPLISYRALAVGAGLGELGLIAAMFSLVPALLAVPLGRYARPYQLQVLMIGGTVVLATATAVLSQADSLLEFVAGSILLGSGHLLTMLAVQSLIGLVSPLSDQGRRFAFFGVAAGFGHLVGPALGGALLSASTGADTIEAATELALLAGTGIAVLAFGMTLVVTPAVRRHAGTANVAPAGADKMPMTSLLRTSRMPTIIMIGVVALACTDLITVYLPVLGEQLEISPLTVGLLLSLRAAATTVVRLYVHRLADWLGRTMLLGLSLAIAAVAMILVPVSNGAALLAALIAVIGIALGTGQPLTIAWTAEIVSRKDRTYAIALRLSSNRAGQTIIPGLAGIVAASAGVQGVFLSLALLLVLVCGATVWRSNDG